jgi:hypothetical protein
MSLQPQIDRASRQCKYIAHKQRVPFSDAFRAAAYEASVMLGAEDVATALPQWWLGRFHITIGTIPAIPRDTLDAWLANEDTRIVKGARPTAAHLPKLHALQFVSEHRTQKWVIAQNMKGIAVPSHELWTYYVSQWPSVDEPGFHVNHMAKWARESYRQSWLTSFRKRWNIGWRRMPPASPNTPDDLRRKAAPPHFSNPLLQPQSVHFFEPKLVHFFEPLICFCQ